MNKIAVAVCDTDREYRDRFVTYLVERKAEEYAVSAFSMPEKLLEALEEEKPDLAICGTGFEEMAERLAGYDIPVLVLQETMADAVAEPVTYGSVPESCRGICRYQSMEVILHEVQVMTLTGAGSRRMENVGTGMEVIGVYSPICHEMQMPFSMVLSSVLAKQRRILYINLMQNTGFLQLFDSQAEYDIGDLTLRLRRGTTESEQFFQSIYEMGDFSYVAPFRNPEQLGEFQMDDYRKLLAHLEENTKFDTVVFDFGTGIPSIAAFLEECSSIYCPVKEGYFYECQKAEFVHYLEQVKPDGMSERLQFVNLPFTAKGIRGGGNMLEQLVWSEFGDYIRDYLAGDAYGEI